MSKVTKVIMSFMVKKTTEFAHYCNQDRVLPPMQALQRVQSTSSAATVQSTTSSANAPRSAATALGQGTQPPLQPPSDPNNHLVPPLRPLPLSVYPRPLPLNTQSSQVLGCNVPLTPIVDTSLSTNLDLEDSFSLLQSEMQRANIGRDANQIGRSDQTEDKKRKQQKQKQKKSKKKKSKRSGEDSTIMELSSSSSSSSSESFGADDDSVDSFDSSSSTEAPDEKRKSSKAR